MLRKYLFAISLTALLTLQAQAQTVSPADSSVNDSFWRPEYSHVTVTGTGDRLLSKVPGSATVIGMRELKRIQPYTGNEVLRKVPGLNVVDEEGMGLRINLGVRGLDPDRSANVLVLEDGIPVSLAPYGEPEAYYTPNIDRMGGVEVVKGSGQIMYGPRTVGGVINYLTMEPGVKPSLLTSLRAGNGGYYNFNARFGQTRGNTGLLLSHSHKQADKIGMLGFNIDDFMAKIRLATSKNGSLIIKAHIYNESSNANYIGITQNMFNRGEYYPVMAPDDRMNVRRYSLGAIYHHRLGNNWYLNAMGYAYTTQRNWRRQLFSSDKNVSGKSGIVWGDTSIQGGAIYMQNQTDMRNRGYDVLGSEARINGDWKLGKISHHLDAGLRVNLEKAHEQQYRGNTPDSKIGMLMVDETHPGQAYSGFVQNRFELLKHLSITAGLRYENYTFHRQINLYKTSSGSYRDTFLSSGKTLSQLIPGIGFNYNLKGKNWNSSIYGGVHRGFAPPRIKSSVSATGIFYPLDPQLSTNYEIGVRSRSRKAFQGEMTLFYMDFDKQVIPVSESSGGQGSGFANAGHSKYRGAEISAMYDLFAHLSRPGSLYAGMNFTFVETWYASDRYKISGTDTVNIRNNALPYAPRNTYNISLGNRSFHDRLEVQLVITHVGKQYSDELNTLNASADGRTGEIPAWTTADFSASWQVKKYPLLISAAVKNITDARYIASRRPQGIKTGMPRLISAGLEWRF